MDGLIDTGLVCTLRCAKYEDEQEGLSGWQVTATDTPFLNPLVTRASTLMDALSMMRELYTLRMNGHG